MKRFEILFGAILLTLALAASACSSGKSASPEPEPTATPNPASERTTPTTDTDASEESVAPANPTSNEPATTTPTTAAEVEAFLDQLETRGFDGVVAVREGGNITTRAFGIADRENDLPIDTETVFDIASISKQFTAAAILRLEMDGLLSVDDRLGQHVPGLPDDKAAITLHQLLTHTAGVQRSLGGDYEPASRRDFLELFGDTPLMRTPGDLYEYSNAGYSLLTAVIEFVTGEPYETYVQTALFEPAGMQDTGYLVPDWDDHTIAVGYTDPSGDRFGYPNEQPWDVDGPYWHLRGNGGIMSTAADMLRWDEALMGDHVLDATARAKFSAPYVPIDPDGDIQYGYGWLFVPMPTGAPLIAHNGYNGAFYADFLRFVDRDVTIFVVTNQHQDEHADVASELANHVLDGELTAMSDGDSDDEDETEANTEAGEVSCGFIGLTIDSLPDYPEIATLPDSPAGRSAMIFLDLLEGGDAAARLDFANTRATEELHGEDPATFAAVIAGFQEQFAKYELTQILQQDDRRFHLLVEGPNGDLLVSLGFDETNPKRLACIGLSN